MVFYSLTAHPRGDVFQRIVTALIFTALAQLAVNTVAAGLSLWADHWFAIGVWSENVELAWGMFFGPVCGGVWAYLVNRRWPHSMLYKWKVTKKTGQPSEWFTAFATYDRYIILDLKEGQRVMGWPREWPNEPASGHFLLERPAWLLKTGERIHLPQVEVMLIDAKDVTSVEFLRFADDPVLIENKGVADASSATLSGLHKEAERESTEQLAPKP